MELLPLIFTQADVALLFGRATQPFLMKV